MFQTSFTPPAPPRPLREHAQTTGAKPLQIFITGVRAPVKMKRDMRAFFKKKKRKRRKRKEKEGEVYVN